MYAEDISRCTSTPGYPNNNSSSTIYERSLFSFSGVFEYSWTNSTRYVLKFLLHSNCINLCSDFVTASSKLLVEKV